ncbi:MAG: transketolase [Candidatus Gracilibacteria bacterium]|nr:transketolase [Candidatus Gracilibacteria bacterium]
MKNILQKQSDTIKFLCADMVQRANSGHPGAPMGLSDVITVLSKHLKHNPENPKWINRDRLVFSGGHISSLIYSFLHLTGYDISLDDLKNFRQLGSKTPGHPEYKEVPGIEITTGPLGQGIANAVGFSMSSKYAKNLSSELGDHKVICFCGDGDLQEGISYEACSLAGKQKLDNLIMIYDSNNITIEGDTDLAWDENIEQRFISQNWNVITIDGHNFEEIDKALILGKISDRPFLIIAKTKIGKGSVNKEGSASTHGSPLGEEEIKLSKIKAGFDPEKSFYIDDEVLKEFRIKRPVSEIKIGSNETSLKELLNPDFSKIIWPDFSDIDSIATRSSNGQILNSISKAIPGFIGGSADLSPSNKTQLIGEGIFPEGKNIYFGIREHAMGAIVNAMNLYGLFRVFSATFFVFSDYLKPSARIAALAGIPQIFIWTHDSIGVGEDGPTHQPIEHLTQFIALPNFYNFRPATAFENIECFKKILKLESPSSLILSRQNLVNYKYSPIIGSVENGAYLFKKSLNPQITLLASGSELELIINSAKILEESGIGINIISMPCFDLLEEQSPEYINSIFDKNTKIIGVEAARGLELYKYCDEVISMNTFGASGKATDLFEKFGFTVENVVERVELFVIN